MNIFLFELGKMSFQASLAVGVVYIMRLFLDKMKVPKMCHCYLWLVPYLVMVLPWKIECSFGFWRGTQGGYVPVKMPVQGPLTDVERLLPEYQEPVLWGQVTDYGEADASHAMLLLGIWIGGLALLLIKSLISYYRLQKKLVCSVSIGEGIYMADDIDTPFVLGMGRPGIFLPSGMDKDMLPFVIKHEKMHIKRKDPLVKTVAFLITCIHWFNPAAWAALYGLEQDMEMACDEGAVRILGKEQVSAYAETLVKAVAAPEVLPGAFAAFGEGSVKKRITNILQTKRSLKTGAVLGTVAVLLLGTGFLTEAKELPRPVYIADALEKVFADIPKPENAKDSTEDAEWHRDGYEGTILHMYIPQSAKDSGYVTEGFWDLEAEDMLAQQAMRELYDLTGAQIEECYYFAYDHGYFAFSLTKDDLEHGRNFYCRQFENGDIIQGIDMASARRVWYSPVDMLAQPEGYAGMTEADRAKWFVEHSGLYNGKKTDHIYQPYDWDPDIWRVVMEDDTAYEVFMDPGADIFSNIAGPYPDSNIRH